MNIKNLVLKSFGKFQNIEVELKPGVNLIVGANESGKSTIHKFIEGIFYGFYKQNIKNKKLSEVYDHYLPWENSNEFSGVMILEDQREVRIERSFMKTKDEVHLFDNLTGENIEYEYAYDSVTRSYQPGIKHLGMSLAAYKNTVSVGQMESKTSAELINEIRDNMINLGETKRIDVSLSNVLKKIADKKLAIGTEKSKKSDLGRTKDAIAQIEMEKEDAQKIWSDIEKLREKEIALKNQAKDLNEKKQNIEKQMNQYRLKEDKSSYQKVKAIRTKLKLLEMEMNELQHFNDVSKEEIDQAIQKLSNIEFLKRENDNQKEKMEELSQRIETMENEVVSIDSIIVDIGLSEKISRDVYKYDEFENSKKYAGQALEGETPDQLKEILKKARSSKLRNSILFAFTLILFLAFAGIKVFEYLGSQTIGNEVSGYNIADLYTVASDYTLYSLIGVIAFFVLMLLFGVLKTRAKRKIKEFNTKINQAINDEVLFGNRLKDICERQNQLLHKYECGSYSDFLALKDRKIKEELLFEENYKRARQLEEEKEGLKLKFNNERNKYIEQNNKLGELTEETEGLMSSVNAWTEEDLKNTIQKQDKYRGLKQEKESNDYIFEELTRGKSYLLEKQDEGFDFDEETDEPHEYDETLTESYDELENQLSEQNAMILADNKELITVSADIAFKESRLKKPALLEEELRKNYDELSKMNFKLSSFDLIEEVILEISENMQNNFAPLLNEKLSKIVAAVTDYKYNEVKVDSNIGISVLDCEAHKLVDVADLSAGTLDMIYFALRLSISEIMSNGKKLPIILDDSFVQYDEHRFVKALEYLTRLDRQVILFTCHKRELNLIKSIHPEVHIVNL